MCLCRYLEVEWELRKGTKRRFCRDTMRGSNPRVPQQDNYSDCGVYLLQYVESFLQVRGRGGQTEYTHCVMLLRDAGYTMLNMCVFFLFYIVDIESPTEF